MENKVYYGEYSLSHWIKLLKTENIKLPWYQRSFVWGKKDVEKLVETFDNNEFVPPIVIGAVKRTDGSWENDILDGQQRLTAILFIKLNKYIDKAGFLSKKPNNEIRPVVDDVVDDDDDVSVEIDNDNKIRIIKWTFKDIIKNKELNQEELKKEWYKELFDIAKSDDFFDKHYLGFSYIKPDNNITLDVQSKFYSDIFRNINTGGIKLTRQESRKALYFLRENLSGFFAPEFLNNIKVITSSKESGSIDFIKYLSILSQYKGVGQKIYYYGFGRKPEQTEDYYTKYITAIIDNENENEYNFNISYFNTDFNTKMNLLESTITQLQIPELFNSVIDMDMYFFGLVNEILFLGNELDAPQKEALKTELDTKISNFKDIPKHKDNPNGKTYLMDRINNSLTIYAKYRKIADPVAE